VIWTNRFTHLEMDVRFKSLIDNGLSQLLTKTQFRRCTLQYSALKTLLRCKYKVMSGNSRWRRLIGP